MRLPSESELNFIAALRRQPPEKRETMLMTTSTRLMLEPPLPLIHQVLFFI